MSMTIHKKIVVNEENKPVEVIITYDEWQKIEQALQAVEKGISRELLGAYAGAMHIEEEPLEYQRRVRSEWK
jgi:PHD/YefM family antitoxin component YafN of YafNO toxin-antitoxin module